MGSGRWALSAGILAVLAFNAVQLAAQDQRALMVDEAWRDPELVLARHDILVSALKHDTASLRPNLDTQFLSSFGGGGGIDEFFGSLMGNPGLWSELIEVLSLGGRLGADGASFSAPFWAAGLECTPLEEAEATSSDTTPDVPTSNFDCDGFEVLLVLGTKVRVRATPGGAAIDAISLDLVSKDRRKSDVTTADGTVWTPIMMRNRKFGWIAARLLRSPIDRRAGFHKGPDGRWRMTSFVAGD